MASYPDYTESIAQLEGVQARSLGTIGNAIQAAPQAIGAAGTAMEGIGKNLDEARFTALKAQGLTALEQMAQEKGHTPEQMAVYKSIWNQPDGQNKAYLMFQSFEKQNHQKKMGELVANEFATKDEYMAAKADADAKGQPLLPPSMPDPMATPPLDTTAPPVTAPPAVGETVAPPATDTIPEFVSTTKAEKTAEQKLRENYSRLVKPQDRKAFEKRHPEIDFTVSLKDWLAKQSATPTTTQTTAPVIKPLIEVPKTNADIKATVDLTSARVKSTLDKAGLDTSVLNNLTLNDVRKIALSIYSDDEKLDSENDKHIKNLLSNPEAAADMADPNGVIRSVISSLPKDEKQANKIALITKMMDTYISEANAASKNNKSNLKDQFYVLTQITKYNKDHPVAAYEQSRNELIDSYGLGDAKLDPNKFKNTGWLGLLSRTSPSIANFLADGLRSMGFDKKAESLNTSNMQQAMFEKLSNNLLKQLAGTTFTDKYAERVKALLGNLKFTNPAQIQAALARFFKEQEVQNLSDWGPYQKMAMNVGLDPSTDIPGFRSPMDILSMDDYIASRKESNNLNPSENNATHPGAATPNTAPVNTKAPLNKTPAKNKPSNAKANDIWHDLGGGAGYWGPA